MTEIDSKEKLNQKGKEMEEQLERKFKHILNQRDRKQKEPRGCDDISKKAADDLKKVGSHDMSLPNDYERMSADFQRKLIKRYERYMRQVSSIPLKPHRKNRNVCDVYVPPWMTVEKRINDQSKELEEVKISMHELFRNEEGRANNIYVIGDAGTGKSIFCKMLLHCWCIAHSHGKISLDESYIVNEMKCFKFLFHVSLRHLVDCESIEQMLEISYHDPVLADILQNDSGKCLIVLDGLDEWTLVKKHNSQILTPGLPGRQLDADYTIITTTRQWKFDALQINENEVDTKISLKGIDTYQMKRFTEKTVKILNDSFQQSKDAENCESDLQSRAVFEISHVPLILQQLICLWFDDKLGENAKYAIYSNMLSLFFDWNALKKTSEAHKREILIDRRMNDLPLPDYLYDFKAFRGNTRVIQYLSLIAYETLFDKNKATTLTFSPTALERLNIPYDIIKYCLEIGILTEEENESMPAGTSQQSFLSFFHKSFQEYLAAVYVASQLNEMLKSRKLLKKENDDLTDVYKTCVRKYFGSCKTVVDILDQSNVLMILCGLEPQLLTNVSKYIYDVTLVDEMIVEERFAAQTRFSSNRPKLIAEVQACIFMCIAEVLSREKTVQTQVYIADIYITVSKYLQRYVENIILKTVLSVHVDMEEDFRIIYDEDTYFALGHFTNCDQMKAIRSNSSDFMIGTIVINILDRNLTTLESVSLLQMNERITTHLVSVLPNMRRLTILQMMAFCSVTISHDNCVSLFSYVNQTTRLKQIALDICCKKCDKHKIDLLNQKQLQYVDFMYSSLCMVSCNTDNLETCKLSINSNDMMKQVCNSLYKADKIKHLCLHCGLLIRYSETVKRTVTENLIRLLLKIGSLSSLELLRFTFTDNIIPRPCDMKNLRELTLNRVIMSMNVWCKFIDCLPALPKVVTVKTYSMDLGDGTIIRYGLKGDEKQVAAAKQYVREKMNLFRVKRDYIYGFQFTTKKE